MIHEVNDWINFHLGLPTWADYTGWVLTNLRLNSNWISESLITCLSVRCLFAGQWGHCKLLLTFSFRIQGSFVQTCPSNLTFLAFNIEMYNLFTHIRAAECHPSKDIHIWAAECHPSKDIQTCPIRRYNPQAVKLLNLTGRQTGPSNPHIYPNGRYTSLNNRCNIPEWP